MKFAMTKAFAFMAGIGMCIAFTGCKDDDTRMPATDGGYSVEMEIELTPQGSDNSATPAEVTIVKSQNSGSQETVTLNQSWETEVTCPDSPDMVGFIITPSAAASYRVSYNMTIMRDGAVAGHISDEQTVTVNPEEDTDAGAYIFKVADGRFERMEYKDMLSGDDNGKDNPQPTPEKDKEEVKVNGTLYFLSEADETDDDTSMHDNFISRFPNRALWQDKKLGKGDYLLLKGSEIGAISLDMLKESMQAGAVVVIDRPLSAHQLLAFCDKTGVYNPLYRDGDDVSHLTFVVASSDVPFYSTEDNYSYHGLFMSVSPRSDSDAFTDDYAQGGAADRIARLLNEINTVAAPAKAATRNGDLSELTTIATAYKVFLNDKSLVQTLSRSAYRGGDYASESQSNYYNLEFDVWNVHSDNEKRNYYYIHQEFLGSFAECYKGVHSKAVTTNGCYTMAKVCEWYGDKVTVTATPSGCSGMQIHRNSPATTNTSTTYTSGVEWNFSGDVSYSQESGWGGTAHGGLTLNSSKTYTKEDISVYNNCSPGRKLSWTFDLKKPDTSFSPWRVAGTNMYEGAAAGRSSLSVGMDYLISFPDSEKEPAMHLETTVTLRSTCGKCGSICGERTTNTTGERNIYLPVISSK